MIAMEGARAGARQRARQKRTGQLDLLAASDLHDTSHFHFLRNTFSSRAEKAIREKIVSVKRVLYDELWRSGDALSCRLAERCQRVFAGME